MKKQPHAKKAKTENAISLLEAQHREVEVLFKEFESVSEDEDSAKAFALAGKVCEKLTVHATIEEEIFYPAAQSEETEDGLAEAAVEHMSAKRLIADIQALGKKDNKKLKALMSVLQEQIEHHVGEEEGQLFPQSAEVLSADELVELGQRLKDRADELKKEGAGAAQDSARMAADDDDAEADDLEVDDDVSKDQLTPKKLNAPSLAPKKNAKSARASS